MKKIITLICALAGFASMSSAASVDDLVPLKHSYVLVCDEWNNNGTEKIASSSLPLDMTSLLVRERQIFLLSMKLTTTMLQQKSQPSMVRITTWITTTLCV